MPLKILSNGEAHMYQYLPVSEMFGLTGAILSSLLCPCGLQLIAPAQHYMLNTRGVLLVDWVLQKQPLTRTRLSQEVREAWTKIVIAHQMFAGAWGQTHLNQSQVAKNKEVSRLPPTPAGAQMSAVISHLLVLPFPASCDIKEAWALSILKMDLRTHLLSWCLLHQ